MAEVHHAHHIRRRSRKADTVIEHMLTGPNTEATTALYKSEATRLDAEREHASCDLRYESCTCSLHMIWTHCSFTTRRRTPQWLVRLALCIMHLRALHLTWTHCSVALPPHLRSMPDKKPNKNEKLDMTCTQAAMVVEATRSVSPPRA